MFPQRLCLLKRSLLALFFIQDRILKQESADLAFDTDPLTQFLIFIFKQLLKINIFQFLLVRDNLNQGDLHGFVAMQPCSLIVRCQRCPCVAMETSYSRHRSRQHFQWAFRWGAAYALLFMPTQAPKGIEGTWVTKRAMAIIYYGSRAAKLSLTLSVLLSAEQIFT